MTRSWTLWCAGYTRRALADVVARSKAGLKLVFVDACRMPPPGDDTPRKVTPPPKVATFFGCADRQYCLEDDDHKHGVFSYFDLAETSARGLSR